MLGSLHREEDDPGDLEGPTRHTWGNPGAKLSHELRKAQADEPNEVWYHKRHGLFGPPQPPDSRFGQFLPKYLIERPQFSGLLSNPAQLPFPKLLISTRLPLISYYIHDLAHTSDTRQDPELPHLPVPKTLASSALLNVSLGSGSSLAWNRLKKSGALPQKERETVPLLFPKVPRTPRPKPSEPYQWYQPIGPDTPLYLRLSALVVNVQNQALWGERNRISTRNTRRRGSRHSCESQQMVSM